MTLSTHSAMSTSPCLGPAQAADGAELAAPRGGIRSQVTALLRALRPAQWVKNLLVLAALVFSGSLLQATLVLRSLAAFACFCAASSAAYLLNDLRDRAEDQRHPGKRHRPLASGALSPALAAACMLLLLVASLLGAWALSQSFSRLLGLYVALNLMYSFGLKRVVIVDAMMIALGFVLRAVAGGLVISVMVTHWLLLCTMMLALFLAFGKRRQELLLLEHAAADHRAKLGQYSVAFLDRMMTISAAVALMTYALYTVAPDTVARVHSQGLVFTVPCVVFGIYRYLFLVTELKLGGDPTQTLLRDVPMLVNLFLWLLIVLAVLYAPHLPAWP